jgi:hypothetical protein
LDEKNQIKQTIGLSTCNLPIKLLNSWDEKNQIEQTIGLSKWNHPK